MCTASHPQRQHRGVRAPPDPSSLSPARLCRANSRADGHAVGAAKDLAQHRIEPKLRQLLMSLNLGQHIATFESEELTIETLKSMPFAELRAVFPPGSIPAGRLKTILTCCADPGPLTSHLAAHSLPVSAPAESAEAPGLSPDRATREGTPAVEVARPAEPRCFLANCASGVVHASPDGKRRLCTGTVLHSAIQVASPIGWTVCDHSSERCRRFVEQALGSADC